MKRLADFLVGLLYALLFVWALLAFLSLAGCANGVQMSDEETIACRNEGCAVYTERELRDLANRAARAGYRRGWTDAHNQSGRGL
jgi:hypothetical protein